MSHACDVKDCKTQATNSMFSVGEGNRKVCDLHKTAMLAHNVKENREDFIYNGKIVNN